MSAMTAAIAIGHSGREGATTGGLFALLALATLARMAIVAAQLNKDAGFSALLPWLPGLAWLAAGLLLIWLALRFRAPVRSRHFHFAGRYGLCFVGTGGTNAPVPP
jgi:hypothetical protein